MSWKRRHKIAEEEAHRWWVEVLKQDKELYELGSENWRLARAVEQAQAESAATRALLWEAVAEVNRLRDMEGVAMTEKTLEEHAAAVGVDLMMPDAGGGFLAEARGLTHRIEFCENENGTGWIVSVFSPLGAANLPQEQAEFFARLLLTGGSGA